MRKAAQITGAALIAAVLVTGCSSSNDDKDDKKSPIAGGQSNAPAGGDGSTASGTYISQAAGSRPVSLVITGDKAAIAGPHLCQGTYSNNMLMLQCSDGNTDRTKGKVTVSDGGKTVTVDWDALSENDTFTRTGDMPTGGVPTGVPTNVPTDLPTGIELPDSAGGIG
ncbi:hypothetical protein ACQUSR_13560 [Streptomyces sp. P1-3]|uniref:hypothetical protein n=1 Tax=Streptomyces sp. P1-3 TaxID=3421658 RepID=UPI003D365962